jgi:hypothetical protein
MAVEHKSISGSYDKKVEDSSHQASNKFGNPINKPTDDLPKPSQKANMPKDSKDSAIG